LVTGGAGYIGSHCCVELLCAGFDVTVVDNLSNGCEDALRRVESISGRRLEFHEADLRDRGALDRIVRDGRFESVIHFAGLKAVGESARLPLEYYENNVGGTLVLLDCMRRHGPRRLVFSSSATVYGDPEAVPIREDAALRPTNPYGRTKLFIEEILRDLAATCDGWHIALLRYFNPVGAHQSGLIGEDPRGTPNNLMPYIMQVAVGRIPELQVFGNDYPTHDGTGVRDYIHVVDLSKGHLAALDHLDQIDGAQAWNLGTGRGYSVLEVVAAASEASGRAIPYRVTGRRVGDVAEVYADPSRATADLSWRADLDLERMCADSWRWQRQNPRGFE
jgi:UDP-glucose 4-epimerase